MNSERSDKTNEMLATMLEEAEKKIGKRNEKIRQLKERNRRLREDLDSDAEWTRHMEIWGMDDLPTPRLHVFVRKDPHPGRSTFLWKYGIVYHHDDRSKMFVPLFGTTVYSSELDIRNTTELCEGSFPGRFQNSLWTDSIRFGMPAFVDDDRFDQTVRFKIEMNVDDRGRMTLSKIAIIESDGC